MSDLISRSELLNAFNNKNIQITFDLPVEEVLGEDVDLDDFAILVQDAIQSYRKMVIDTIKSHPTAYDIDKVVEQLEKQKSGLTEWAEDEAIAHEREVAERQRKDNDDCEYKAEYGCKDCTYYYSKPCIECAEESERLAEWLEELKALKNGLNIKCDNLNEALEKGKKIGYNKAIDDFIEKVELKYLGVHPDELYDKYYPREICKQIKEIAEQLKVGEMNEM